MSRSCLRLQGAADPASHVQSLPGSKTLNMSRRHDGAGCEGHGRHLPSGATPRPLNTPLPVAGRHGKGTAMRIALGEQEWWDQSSRPTDLHTMYVRLPPPLHSSATISALTRMSPGMTCKSKENVIRGLYLFLDPSPTKASCHSRFAKFLVHACS